MNFRIIEVWNLPWSDVSLQKSKTICEALLEYDIFFALASNFASSCLCIQGILLFLREMLQDCNHR